MDHSLRAYLERQSTETLDRILQECMEGDGWNNYAHVIPEIKEILQQREQAKRFLTPPLG